MKPDSVETFQAKQRLEGELARLITLLELAAELGIEKLDLIDLVFDIVVEHAGNERLADSTNRVIAEKLGAHCDSSSGVGEAANHTRL